MNASNQTEEITISFRKLFWWLLLIILTGLLIFTDAYPHIIQSFRKQVSTQQAPKGEIDGLDVISYLPGWTAEIYENIDPAIEHYDANSKVSYSDGSQIEELLKQVPNPSYMNYYESSSTINPLNLVNYTWDTPYYIKGYSVNIYVSTDKATGQIIDKHISAYNQDEY